MYDRRQPVAEPRPRAAHAVEPAAPEQAGAAPLVRGAAGRPLSPGQVLQLQRRVGNGVVGRLLAGTVQREETEEPMAQGPEAAVAEEPAVGEAPGAEGELEDPSPQAQAEKAPAIPVGGGHHATVREVGGRLRLGFASEFTDVAHIVQALLAVGSPLSQRKRRVVQQIQQAVEAEVQEMNDLRDRHVELYRIEQEYRQEATKQVPSDRGPYAKIANRLDRRHPSYRKFIRARNDRRDAQQAWLAQQTAAVNLARDAIVKLWDIGKDFLPTHLMPVGEVFRDKADFAGDTDSYTYHTGAADDPIPITWYKAPGAYPRLQLANGTRVAFGDAFSVGGKNFGLGADNKPKVGWTIRKTAHNETREGQQEFNRTLVDGRVKVEKGGGFVTPPLGDRHQFDGDHVKDLGFGGSDTANNYWPLDSTINRRAFTGYNSAYVVNYIDANGDHKSRAIGGLVGKWFKVERFLGNADGPVPQDGEAAGGS